MPDHLTRNKLYKYPLDRVFTALFTFLLLAAVFNNIFVGNWFNLFLSLISLALIYLPYIIAHRFEMYIPPKFQVALVIFIYASIYLGEVRGYYLSYWWWDKLLHTISGIILGFIGFIFLYFLNRNRDIQLFMSPLTIAIFSFTFAVTLGTFWEIFEFTMDNTLGFTMQRFGLTDTMWDLIVDCLGTTIASVSGYLYLKTEEPTFFEEIVDGFYRNQLENYWIQ